MEAKLLSDSNACLCRVAHEACVIFGTRYFPLPERRKAASARKRVAPSLMCVPLSQRCFISFDTNQRASTGITRALT